VGRAERTRLQLQTALASVATVFTDVEVEIGGRGLGTHLRLVGDAANPPFVDQLHDMTEALRDAGDLTASGFRWSFVVPPSPIVLSFHPWVPLLPGRLRARLTAQSTVEYVTAFLDARLGIGGWVGGGRDVRTRVRGGRVEVLLTPRTGGPAVRLPPLPLSPFQRRRPDP